jgi:GNAT superfamily N-acetyltransferase
MGDVKIRVAQGDDLEALRAIYVAASLSNDGDRPHLLQHPEVLEFSGAGVGEGRTAVAVEGGADAIVGFATYAVSGVAMEVVDLFVEPAHMRHGVGRALLRDLVERARGLGLARLEVTANQHALAFYEAVGFVTDGERATQFSVAPHMALVLG